MRRKVQAVDQDPVSLYGFCLAPDALEELIGAPEAASAPPTESGEPGIDYTRFGKMIRRNRDWVR